MKDILQNNILLSVLITTHKRPKTFKRCLESVLKNKPDWCEILVNFDDCDYVEEYKNKNIKIFTNNPFDISENYKLLLDNSKGKYIYFLEDDDYVVKNFYFIIYNNIKTNKNLCFRYSSNYEPDIFLKLKTNFKEYFQLSQMVILRDNLTKIDFPKDNNIYNDYKIYKQLDFLHLNDIIYIQTTDAKDNISFKKYNKDNRFEQY